MNKPAMRELKKWIREEPRRYNQGTWGAAKKANEVIDQKPPCGMVACLGGNAVLMRGYQLVYPREGDRDYASGCRLPNKRETLSIEETAQEILGLTWAEAEVLFDGEPSNWTGDADDLLHKAGDIDEQIERMRDDFADEEMSNEHSKEQLKVLETRLNSRIEKLTLAAIKLRARAAIKQIDYMIAHPEEPETDI